VNVNINQNRIRLSSALLKEREEQTIRELNELPESFEKDPVYHVERFCKDFVKDMKRRLMEDKADSDLWTAILPVFENLRKGLRATSCIIPDGHSQRQVNASPNLSARAGTLH